MAVGGRGGGGTRHVAALVGRGRELRDVRAALRDRHPVAITGAAGTGRTALARAALHTRAAAWGGGLATLAGRPYAALEWALAAEAPGGVGQVGDIAEWVAGGLGGRALAVDDLQLTHPATVAVLELLAGAVPLVVTLATDHPGAGDLGRTLAGWSGVELVELAPLDPGSARRLVRRIAPALPEDDAARLVACAGGSPHALVTAAAAAATELADRPAHAQPATRSPAAALTTREAQVLKLIAAGAKTVQIAARLGIADSTVESHVRAIRTKLGVPTRTAAAAWAC